MAERKTTKSTSRATTAPKRTTKKTDRLDPAQIAQLAYERFLARGAVHGRDVEDWLAAEQELRTGR